MVTKEELAHFTKQFLKKIGGVLTGALTLPSATFNSNPSGTPDANTLYKANIAKGWIRFDGTGTVTIEDSFNVASLDDNGTGDYTVNWDRDFANAYYVPAGMAQRRLPVDPTGILEAVITNAAAFNVNVRNNSTNLLEDHEGVCIVVFGTQS